MRIDLGQLSLAGLSLDLSRDKHAGDRVVVHTAQDLRGTMLSDVRGFELSDVSAPRVQLDSLQLTFGSLTLRALDQTVFEGLTAALGTRSGGLAGRVQSLRTHAAQLSVHIGSLTISAEFSATDLVLELRAQGGGNVHADHALFRNVTVESAGALRFAIPELRTEGLRIGWGEPEFNLRCARAHAPELELTRAATQFRATGVNLEDALYAHGVRLGRVQLERLEGNLSLPKPTPETAAPARTSTPPPSRLSQVPVWDLALLDRVSGNVQIDVEVDLAVPIIGRRRATHELRVPLSQGSLDYLVLESGLSRLEDSLLDFAVRDGALALEVGIPLVGVRGRGKPIVYWDLSPEDYRLAERNRVRLAVLPYPRLATPRTSEPPPEPGTSPGSGARFALRHITLANIDTELQVAPQAEPMNAALRELSLGNLHVQGTVHYDPESSPRSGLLRVQGEKLKASLCDLPLGKQALGMSLQVDRIEDGTLNFEGTRLVQAVLALDVIELDGLSLCEQS